MPEIIHFFTHSPGDFKDVDKERMANPYDGKDDDNDSDNGQDNDDGNNEKDSGGPTGLSLKFAENRPYFCEIKFETEDVETEWLGTNVIGGGPENEGPWYIAVYPIPEDIDSLYNSAKDVGENIINANNEFYEAISTLNASNTHNATAKVKFYSVTNEKYVYIYKLKFKIKNMEREGKDIPKLDFDETRLDGTELPWD